MSVTTKLQAARYLLANERPYLASAVLAMVPVERAATPTIGVDAWWRLYYNLAWVEARDVPELAGVVYHEVLHLLRDHAGRCKAMSAEARLYNLAADLEINDDVRADSAEAQFRLPDGGVLPEQFGLPAGLLAEEYYERLLQRGRAQGKKGRGEDGPGRGVCGSCATGQQEPWEDPPPSEGQTDALPGISPAEAEVIRRSVAEAIQTASKTRGNVPAHLRRFAESKLSPKVDWRKMLAGAVRATLATVSGAVDYSYSRPSRRQGAYGNIIMPALRRPLPEVTVVVDTSGSISDDMLARSLAEVSGVLKATGVGVTVLAVDAAVHTCRRVFSAEQVEAVGGGGTDMGVGIEYATTKLRPRPHVVVVLTDGWTPWPPSPPRAKVIVCLLDGDARNQVPAWARVIAVEE